MEERRDSAGRREHDKSWETIMSLKQELDVFRSQVRETHRDVYKLINRNTIIITALGGGAFGLDKLLGG